MTRTRPAEVRFYIDADVLGLARILADLRSDVTFPGDRGAEIKRRRRPPCPIATPKAKDIEWIPVVAKAGWLVITRDRKIEAHRREIELVRAHQGRLVTLSGPDARGTWQQLQIVMRQWSGIEAALDRPGPFILRATLTTLSPVPLTGKQNPAGPRVSRASTTDRRWPRPPRGDSQPDDELPLDLPGRDPKGQHGLRP